MNADAKIADLLSGIVSENNDEQIASLDSAIEIANTLAERAVQGLRNRSNRLFVAERLIKLGFIVVAPLEQLLISSSDSEEKIVASMVLIDLNSRVGVPYLLDAIETNEDIACLAAHKLANANVTEAVDKIISRLSRAKLSDIDLVVCLLLALKKLNASLPLELNKRFSSDASPWQIRTLLSSDS